MIITRKSKAAIAEIAAAAKKKKKEVMSGQDAKEEAPIIVEPFRGKKREVDASKNANPK